MFYGLIKHFFTLDDHQFFGINQFGHCTILIF